MTTNSRKGPIVDPGICRCCGAMKKCRLLNVEYEWQGQREVYSDMFVDCFGLVLSHLDGEETERLICATCVVRLRDARAFRQQVLQCEEKLLSATVYVHDLHTEIDIDMPVKQEVNIVPEPQDESDDDRDMLTDPIEDMPALQQEATEKIETSLSIQVKVEEMQEDAIMSQQHQTEGATEVCAKTDMLDKLKRMKHKLNKMQSNSEEPRQSISPRQESPTPPRTKRTSYTKRSISPHKRPMSPHITKGHILPLKKLTTLDKDVLALKNTIQIVNNSYVCPFATVFSDYHCVYCKEMFLDPKELREHTMSHDPRTYKDIVDYKKLIQVDITRIDCRLCDQNIDSIDSFKEHITKSHGLKIYPEIQNEFMKFKLTVGNLTCTECGKNVEFFHALKKHMAQHFGTYICDVCGAHYFEERHLILHKETHDQTKKNQIFPCNECEKTFKSKSSRNFHIARIHKNEPMYPCNKCDEIFISYHMRYRHKMTVHGEQRKFPCQGCEKVFDSRKTLREHNQRTHLQLLRHECSLCDKKFYLPSALRDHMTTHTGERNFRCEFCGKNYPRSKALKVHIQSHSTEKKYKCNLCPSSYTQITNYKNHMRSKHPTPEVEGYR